MNTYAMIIGYIVMGLSAPICLWVGLLWVLNKIPPINRKLMQILRLGMKAYLELPKDQRK